MKTVVRERDYGIRSVAYRVMEFDDGTITVQVRHHGKVARARIEEHLADARWFVSNRASWLKMYNSSKALFHLGEVLRDYESHFRTGKATVVMCDPGGASGGGWTIAG